MLFVVGQLNRAAAFGLVDGLLHGVGDFVGIHYHLTVEVTCGAADGLGERAVAAQEAFFVGVENSHERHLGQVEAFAEQVDADEHIKLSGP